MVVLSFLGSRFFAKQTWLASDRNWPADRGDLFDFGRWKRRRRVALLFADQARAQRKYRPQNRYADLRRLRNTGCVCLPRGEHMVRGFADRIGSCLPPGVVRQPLYSVFGHVSRSSRRIGERNWWHGWRLRGTGRSIRRGPQTSGNRKLQGSISHRRVGLLVSARRDSDSRSQVGTR